MQTQEPVETSQIRIEEAFGIDNLRLHQGLCAAPTGRQVQVQIAASSLNSRDAMMIKGTYNPKQALPLIPNSDGAGVVVAVGPEVDRFKPGDRVCSVMNPFWHAGTPDRRALRNTLGGPIQGMLTQYATLDQDAWIGSPKNLTDLEAATLPCSALTAWSALVTLGNLQPGQTVLVQGTGGVSIFALQFAKALGARVMVISSSDEKLQIAHSLGADETHNYATDPHWDMAARVWTNKNGVDHIVDVAGAATLPLSMNAVAIGGTISVIGVLSGLVSPISVIPLLMQNVRLQGVFVGHRQSYSDMIRAVEQFDIKPLIHSTFTLPNTQDAFHALAQAQHVGKILITLK